MLSVIKSSHLPFVDLISLHQSITDEYGSSYPGWSEQEDLTGKLLSIERGAVLLIE